jgi:hypothetical protein
VLCSGQGPGAGLYVMARAEQVMSISGPTWLEEMKAMTSRVERPCTWRCV